MILDKVYIDNGKCYTTEREKMDTKFYANNIDLNKLLSELNIR